MMINIIYERGGGSPDLVSNLLICRISTGKKVFPWHVSQYVYRPVEGGTVGASATGCVFSIFGSDIVLRSNYAYAGSANREFVINALDGNYNYDNLSITSDNRRVEIRNEYGVLLADNGRPWGDGTYPPDARSRTGLSGLHAAPAVINPELETALIGDATNEEEKLMTNEGLEYVRNALDREDA